MTSPQASHPFSSSSPSQLISSQPMQDHEIDYYLSHTNALRDSPSPPRSYSFLQSPMENRSPLTNLTKQKRNLSRESLSQLVKKDSKSIFGDLVNHDWEAVRYFLSSQAYGGHMSSHSKNKRSNGGTNNRRNKRSREASSCTSSTPIAKEGKKGKAMNVIEEGGKRSRAQPEVTIEEEASSKLGDVEGEAHWMTFLNRDMAIL
ncbi:hypothetical protein HPP92_003457 [Vanilla planifolia]|uniref:Uncharacterized protein n=1 Tax=Vanilla planifolia TaxID=51239 RepID=A0A835SAF0_VANPL|nr:hypothetical protein HPP92_003457 [Vanilla planifolia]